MDDGSNLAMASSLRCVRLKDTDRTHPAMAGRPLEFVRFDPVLPTVKSVH